MPFSVDKCIYYSYLITYSNWYGNLEVPIVSYFHQEKINTLCKSRVPSDSNPEMASEWRSQGQGEALQSFHNYT